VYLRGISMHTAMGEAKLGKLLNWLVLTKRSRRSTRRIYAVTPELHHRVQPIMLLRLTLACYTEAVILRIQNYHMSVPHAVRLCIDAEAVFQ